MFNLIRGCMFSRISANNGIIPFLPRLQCFSGNYGKRSYVKSPLPFEIEDFPKKVHCIFKAEEKELEKIDLTRPRHILENCKELQTADETTKKLLSLEFASRREVMIAVKNDYRKKVQRHKYDLDSPEVKVSDFTVRIRAGIDHLMKTNIYDTRVRRRVKKYLDKRTKELKFIRKTDFKRFQWLVDTLDIEYRAPPCFPHKLTYKGRFQVQTTDLCRKIREERIIAFRDHLRSKQAAFQQQKTDTFKWIAEQELKYNIKAKEVDITVKPTNWKQFIPPKWRMSEMPPPKVIPPAVE